MRQLNLVQYVLERDVDLLLLEELHASEHFRAWFLGRVLVPGGERAEFVGAWHSVTHHGTGESDLEVDDLHGGESWRVLIENKIDAAFQPYQPARYGSRAAAYASAGECKGCRTVLVAPAAYLRSRAGVGEFDVTVAYEALRDWFAGDADLGVRGRHKAQVIGHAITAADRRPPPLPDEQVTAFWFEYGRYVTANAPELVMPPPRPRPRNSTWVTFPMGDLHQRLGLYHLWTEGRVVVWISDMGGQVAQLRERLAACLDRDMSVGPATKSAGVSILVPAVDPTRPFAEQREAAAQGVEAVRRLRLWAEKHHGRMGL